MPLFLMNTDIQHTQMVLGAAMGLAALGTMVLSIVGRWIGVWTTLVALLAAMLLAYQPLIGASLLASYKTDLLRRILVGAVPFVIAAILLSFDKIPFFVRLIFALLGPAALLYWVFVHFDATIPRQEFFFRKIAPVSLVIFAAWMLIEPIAMRSRGSAAPIVIGPMTGGLAFLLMISAESQAGQMAPIIPATALGALLAAIVGWFLRKPIDFSRGPVIFWLTLIGALFAFMWLDTDELPTKYLYWIAAAPVVAWIVELPMLHKQKPWIRESVRLTLVAIPTVVAVYLAFKQHKADAKASGDEYGLVIPHPNHSAAPMCPSQMPMPNTINPPTIT